jgi:oligopeptide/dipeptide ABC transporter ATP-binding protein
MTDHLVAVEALTKEFPIGRARLRGPTTTLRAVDNVTFEVVRGQTFGLVGESGSGKSTIGRCILRLTEPTSGRITVDGTDVLALSRNELRAFRRHMQIVFQDSSISLDPRMSALAQVEEALTISGAPRSERRGRAREMLEVVGLQAHVHARKPHGFSGGQRQRIAFARALIVRPSLVILDEPTSSLDVSIQAQIVNLLRELQDQFGLTYLFITHDLSVAEYLCDRIAVLYRGAIMEVGATNSLFRRPLHPYTAALLSAVPTPQRVVERRERIILPGDGSAADAPGGCRFRARCPVGRNRSICEEFEPGLAQAPGADHEVACHFPGELAANGRVVASIGDDLSPTSSI